MYRKKRGGFRGRFKKTFKRGRKFSRRHGRKTRPTSVTVARGGYRL